MSLISRDNFRVQAEPTNLFRQVIWNGSQNLLILFLFSVFSLHNSSLIAFDESAAEADPNALITEAELNELKKLTFDTTKVIAKSSLSQADILLLKKYARIQILQMSLESKKDELSAIRKRTKQLLPRVKEASKDLLLAEITKQCEKLLRHPSTAVRINAALMITDLNQTPANNAKKIKAVPYAGKVTTLHTIINDPEQHQAVKVIAVNGISRLCTDGSLKVSVRKKIGTSLIREIQKTNSDPWYKRVCIQTLGILDDLYDAQRKPYILNFLCQVLVDNKQPWLVRSSAARALGKAKMDGQTNLPLINHEIARFTYEMGLQYNRNRAAFYWKVSSFQIYSAYRKTTAKDSALLDRVQTPPLSVHKKVTESTYRQVLPVVNAIISKAKPTKIPDATLNKLKTFIDANPPKSFSVAPGSKPIRTVKPTP